jgi:hypothetical protein
MHLVALILAWRKSLSVMDGFAGNCEEIPSS